MGKKSGSGSGMNNPDHISESFETIFWVKILKFFDVDPGFGMEKIRIRDGKKFGSGMNIPNPQHWIPHSPTHSFHCQEEARDGWGDDDLPAPEPSSDSRRNSSNSRRGFQYEEDW
jgi:hypothetical protein